MKKQMFKVISLALAIVLCCVGITVIADDNLSESSIDSGISPCFTAIFSCSRALEKENSWGKLYCEGDTTTYQAYKADVTVELQHYDGSWTTIKSWSDTSTDTYALVAEYYYVGTGSYRLKVTHKGLNSNGTTAETFVAYSDTVSF